MSESQGNTLLNELSSVFTLDKLLQRDFEMMETIGTGGFATVFRVKNRLSNTEYAIKKIVIDTQDKPIQKIHTELEAALNEIRCLSKLQYEYVVRHYHSWIEVELNDTVKDDETRSNEENSFKKSSQHLESNTKKNEEDDYEPSYSALSEEYSDLGIQFESNLGCVKLDFEQEEDGVENESSAGKIPIDKAKSIQETLIINNQIYKLSHLKQLIVYIQMELCEKTLGEYLNEQTQNESPNTFILSNLQLFREVMKAVQYIHNQEKIIHRDIKPNNIFITSDHGVKLGDFGLATEFINKKYLFMNKEGSTRKRSEESTYTNWTDTRNNLNFHTKNVGTIQYASPEQLKENYYDEKTDIFSLGFVLFEMVHPMLTAMEKHHKFMELKTEMKVPQAFSERYPAIAHLISEMVERNPLKRPFASEVLQIITQEIIAMQEKENH